MKNKFLFLILLLLAMTVSCVKDDLEDCGVKIRFRYAYNMKNTDAFAEEVSEVKLWVFDKDEKLQGIFTVPLKILEKDNMLRIAQLQKGNYTFVAMARSVDKTQEYADFEISDLSQGDPLDSLWAWLDRDERNTNSCDLNNLLIGTTKEQMTGVAQSIVIEMMKCTNHLRILLVPVGENGAMEAENLEIWIEGRNGWLAYDASTYRDERLIYRPYYKATLSDSCASMKKVVVAELSTSRLRYDRASRLIIRNCESGVEMMNINLTWLLSLQAIGEHQREWGNQEYLDRQDEYALTFMICEDTWMQSNIVVNGWVLSLNNIGL